MDITGKIESEENFLLDLNECEYGDSQLTQHSGVGSLRMRAKSMQNMGLQSSRDSRHGSGNEPLIPLPTSLENVKEVGDNERP